MTSNKRNLKENKVGNEGQGQIRKAGQKQPPEVFYTKVLL